MRGVGPERVGDFEWWASHFRFWIREFILLVWQSLEFARVPEESLGLWGLWYVLSCLAWLFDTVGMLLTFCL